MIKDCLLTIHIYFFGDAFCIQLYTLSSHFRNNFLVRRQFYQTLLKLSGALNLQLLYCYIDQ